MRQTLTGQGLILLCGIGVSTLALPADAAILTPGDTCAAATFEMGILPYGNINTTTGRDDTNTYPGPCADASTGIAGSATGEDLYYRIRTSASCTLQVTMNPTSTPDDDLGLYIASDCAPLTATNCITMDDNGGAGTTEVVTFAATAGTDYFILVDGVSGADGQYSLTVSSASGNCGSLVPVELQSFTVD